MAADRPPRRLVVHYHRPEGDEAGWNLWVWNDRTHATGRELAPAGRDDFGLVFVVDLAPWARSGETIDPVGFLPRRNHWEERDGDDRVWRPGDPDAIWVMARRPGWSGIRPDTSPFVIGGFLDQPDELLLEVYPALEPSALADTSFRVESTVMGVLDVASAVPAGGDSWLGHRCHRVRVTLSAPIDCVGAPLAPLSVWADGWRPGVVWPRHILDRPEFQSTAPLGAIVAGDATTWRVFAPTAAKVELRLYREATGGAPETVPMAREAGGTWCCRLPGDRTGEWYMFRADGPDPRFRPDREFLDPYARAVSAYDGRARVVGPTAPPGAGPSFGVDEAIVYEVHVRDLSASADSGITARGRYAGLAESGTHLPGDPGTTTGLDHMLELGINTVQVLPVPAFRHAPGAYEWGYMPVLFQAPDGAYASGEDGANAVAEWKEAVDALHRRGLKVVMDVVFNHTAELLPDRLYAYEGLAPGYYHRRHADGSFWNGSGTGNEFRSEAPMARRLILDSLRTWIVDYGVDGFRFDLMGLIDLDTMKAIVRELRALKPDILLWGEPWTAAPSPIAPTVAGMQRGQGFAVFNDHFRNAIRGDHAGAVKSFLAGGGRAGAFRRGLEGSVHDFADTPVESVNYVECHDNQTLWDRLASLPSTREMDEATRTRLHRLAGAAVLLARGIPFLHAGQEFLRTKQGIDNSWDKGDEINRIEWTRKRRHADTVGWHRDLIRLRRAHPLLRRSPGPGEPRDLLWLDDDLKLAVPPPVAALLLGRGPVADFWSEAVLILNPAADTHDVPLPPGAWRVVIDGDHVVDAPLSDLPAANERIPVPPRSLILLARE
ncbi:MAG TPA: pullulanase-associated domain-containing protein [Candidatus Eisenbacteria bacterium]